MAEKETPAISQIPGGDPDAIPRKSQSSVEHVYDVEKTGYDRGAAIEAENMEHRMGVWETVKAYPSATWWAFVMSCTIVSIFTFSLDIQSLTNLDHGSLLCLPHGQLRRPSRLPQRVRRTGRV